MDSVLVALASFIPMLLLLVVVHELGHFWSAKAFGIKVLEFGVGYPPKAFGIYTGRTQTLLSATTVCLNGTLDAIKPGDVIRVLSGETDQGNLVARYVEIRRGIGGSSAKGAVGRFVGFGGNNRDEERPEHPQRRTLQDVESDEYLRHEGKVREMHADRIVLADMLYSVNWLPLGGFVQAVGRKQSGRSAESRTSQRGSARDRARGGVSHERPVPHSGVRNNGDDSAHRADRRDGSDYRSGSRLAGGPGRLDAGRQGFVGRRTSH